MLRRLRITLSLVTAVTGLLGAAAVPAWAAESITVTWVRHAQSTANADGIIDATVPGPGLTALGAQQAVAIGAALAPNAYDGIYVSDMIRTQLTAVPLEDLLGLTQVVIGGVREIAAGILEGLPGTTGPLYAITGLLYTLPAAAWVLGARFLPTPFGEDGNMFDARVDDAIATLYASGDTNAVVFSHGATIQAWTLMNVTNPVLRGPLGNTDVVVVTGNPEDGWTLQSWAGEPVSQTPDLLTKLFVDFRNLVVAPQTAVYNIGQAFAYANWYTAGTSLTAIAGAITGGIVSVATAAVEFVVSVIRDIGGAIFPQPGASAPPAATVTAAIQPPAPTAAGVNRLALRADRPDRTPKPAAAVSERLSAPGSQDGAGSARHSAARNADRGRDRTAA